MPIATSAFKAPLQCICLKLAAESLQSYVRAILHMVKSPAPDILILEIGTNNLSVAGSEVVGSDIEKLVRLILRKFAVRLG